MGFKIKGTGNLVNVNVRKDGPAEELQLATDLKIQVDIEAKELDQLVPGQGSLFAALYDKDGKNPKFENLLDVALDSEFKDHEFKIVDLEKSFHTTKIDKFSAHLRINAVATLTFRIQLHPSKEELAEIADFLRDDFEFEIVGQPDLFDGQDQNQEEEETVQ